MLYAKYLLISFLSFCTGEQEREKDFCTVTEECRQKNVEEEREINKDGSQQQEKNAADENNVSKMN